MDEQPTTSEDLVRMARENPYRFFSLRDAGEVLNFSKEVMTEIVRAGAPMVGGKVNLPILIEWLKVNADKVEKTRSSSPVKKNQTDYSHRKPTANPPQNG